MITQKWFRSLTTYRHQAHYEGVLGTSLEIQMLATGKNVALTGERILLTEIDRLEAIFNAYRSDSEFSRWQTGSMINAPLSPELTYVLFEAEQWRVRTGSTFHPAIEAVTRLWKTSEQMNKPVDSTVLGEFVERLTGPLWEVDQKGGTAQRLTTLPCTLNAIAKGYIIDRAAECTARLSGIHAVLVNIGGDIRHVGSKAVNVAITSPFQVAENAPPVDTVALRGKGMATSGNYRRGFHIEGHWYSHLIDPRTCRPAEHIISASVIAENTMTADVLATAFSILSPEESMMMAESLPGIGLLLVTEEGKIMTNEQWKRNAIIRTEK